MGQNNDDYPNRDEMLRLTALDRAMQNAPFGTRAENVLQRAKAYEDYLRNGEQEKVNEPDEYDGGTFTVDSPFVSEASEATKNVVNGYSDADPFGNRQKSAEDLFPGRQVVQGAADAALDSTMDRIGKKTPRFSGGDRVQQAELMDAEKINRTVWNSAIDAVFALGGDRSNRETFDLGTIRNAVKGLYRR